MLSLTVKWGCEMPARKFEHYNIWTTHCAESVRFYVDALGLREGPRPEFGIPGAWIYDDSDTPVVHLIDVADGVDPRLLELVGRDLRNMNGSGLIDHVAFAATDFEESCSRLDTLGLQYRRNEVPAINLRQIFVDDPNGVRIELNFH
jgi:catechol 2,3-dioxygenase-like lactoylglutathione lyase family enzyme